MRSSWTRTAPWLLFGAYIGAIIAANVITAGTTPFELDLIWTMAVPYGTFFIGLTFILRDIIQIAFGRAAAYGAIATAVAASAVVSGALGDTLAVVAGSAVAFAISESADTEVFTRLRARVPLRIATSGIVGSALDSVLFAVIALSPLWSNIVAWEHLHKVIIGQFLVKAAMQLIASGAWRVFAPERFQRPQVVDDETIKAALA